MALWPSRDAFLHSAIQFRIPGLVAPFAASAGAGAAPRNSSNSFCRVGPAPACSAVLLGSLRQPVTVKHSDRQYFVIFYIEKLGIKWEGSKEFQWCGQTAMVVPRSENIIML